MSVNPVKGGKVNDEWDNKAYSDGDPFDRGKQQPQVLEHLEQLQRIVLILGDSIEDLEDRLHRVIKPPVLNDEKGTNSLPPLVPLAEALLNIEVGLSNLNEHIRSMCTRLEV